MTEWYSGVEPQRGQYRWTVKESGTGTPWLLGEPVGETIKIVGATGEDDLEFGFYLRPGTNLQEAQEVASFLNDRITDVIVFSP